MVPEMIFNNHNRSNKRNRDALFCHLLLIVKPDIFFVASDYTFPGKT